MKRIISVILTVLLVSALAFTFAVSAEDEFALSVKLPETFEADSTIEFSVTVDKIPAGCVGAPLTFDFEGIDIEADGVVAKCTVEGGEIDVGVVSGVDQIIFVETRCRGLFLARAKRNCCECECKVA